MAVRAAPCFACSEPDVIAGKPSPSLMKVIMTTYGLLPSQCVMVRARMCACAHVCVRCWHA